MEVIRANGVTISLPDSLITQIFSLLKRQELCQCALVSKSWCNLALDPVLWRLLDFRSFEFSVEKIKKILEQRCSDALKSLAIKGLNLEPSSISTAFPAFLSSSFPNLTFLHLDSFNLTFVNIADFPPSVRRLELVKCMFPADFFDALKTTKLFPKLEYLDVSMNVGLTDHHVECISYVATLKTLIMKQNRNHDVTDASATHLARLKDIRCLDVANTAITDQGVDCMVSSLPHLRRLNISMLRLSNLTPIAIGQYSKSLEMLILNQVFGVSDIMPLVTLPYITYININNTSVERNIVTDFRIQNPKCTVDFQFERYLKSRAGSSITVSDGRFCI